MKVHHDPENDYLSIDFVDTIEARSVYQDGVIIRYDESDNVIGIDITDSMKLFSSSDLMTLQEACDFLGISASTIRRKIRSNKIRYTKEGNHYRFRKVDILTYDA